ncbi:MAG: TPM domain-containing protein [Selenomonadaceae bacterium]|nr:TPM domain-containing protein [Selenomonadaceae bacterium]
MIKKFLGLLAIIFILNISTASAAQIESVTDEAGVLKATEVELLNQRIRKIEQAHKIKIGVAFVKSIGNSDMIRASNNFLDQYFNNGMNGGIVLLVAMDKRKYEMSTDRRMINIITDYEGIPFLKDKFQSDLSAGNYYNATNNFIDGVDELLTYYETNGEPYGTSAAPGGLDPVTAVLSAVVSILFGVMIRSSLIGKMSNVHHSLAALDYLQKNTVKLTENRDTFLFMNVQRRARGGSSRRGGGHGGGGHGGGGGSF